MIYQGEADGKPADFSFFRLQRDMAFLAFDNHLANR